MNKPSIKKPLRKFRKWREGRVFTSPVIARQAAFVELGMAATDHAGKRNPAEERLLESDTALLSKMLAAA